MRRNPPRPGLLRPALAGAALCAALAAGCRRPPPPTEAVLPAVQPAPLLNEIEDDEGAVQVASPGELLLRGRDMWELRWHGPMEGKPAERQGQVLELTRGPGEGALFGFRGDFGAETRAPTTGWLCERAASLRPSLRPAAGECARRLRRFRVGREAFAAAPVFLQQPFAVIYARGGEVRLADAPPASDTRLLDVGGRPVLVLEERRSEDEGRHTSGRLVAYRFAPSGPEQVATILTDEVDARPAGRVITRIVSVAYEGGTVRVRGERREVATDGREIGRAPIDETHTLAAR